MVNLFYFINTIIIFYFSYFLIPLYFNKLLNIEYAGFLFDIKNKFPTELHRKEWERQFILQSYQLQQRENVTISDEFLNGFDVR